MRNDETTTSLSSNQPSTTTSPSVPSEVLTVTSTQINSDTVAQEIKKPLSTKDITTQEMLNRIILEIYTTEASYRKGLEELSFICNQKINKITAARQQKIKSAQQSYFGFGFIKNENKQVDDKNLLFAQIKLLNEDDDFYVLTMLSTTLTTLLVPFKELDQMKSKISKIKFYPKEAPSKPSKAPENLLTFEEIKAFFNLMLSASGKNGSITNAKSAFVKMAQNYQIKFNKIADLFFTNKEPTNLLESIGIPQEEAKWAKFFDDRLVMPIQRMPRYRLLFEQLCKFLPQEGYNPKEKETLISNIHRIADLMKSFTPKFGSEKEEEISFFEKATSYYRSLTATGIEHTTSDQTKKEKESKNGSPSNSRVEAKSNSKVSPVNSKAEETDSKSDSSKSGSRVDLSPSVEDLPSPRDDEDDGRRVSFIPVKDTETVTSKETETPKPVSKIMPPPPPVRKPRTPSIGDTSGDTSVSTSSTPTKSVPVPPPIPEYLRRKRTESVDLVHSQSALPENKEPASPSASVAVTTTPPPLQRSSTVSKISETRSSFLRQLQPAATTPDGPSVTTTHRPSISVRSTSELFKGMGIMGIKTPGMISTPTQTLRPGMSKNNSNEQG